MHLRKPQGGKESGSVIVLTAMMVTVLFGVMGMAIEVAGFYSLKRKMQTAADAGAKSGAARKPGPAIRVAWHPCCATTDTATGCPGGAATRPAGRPGSATAGRASAAVACKSTAAR